MIGKIAFFVLLAALCLSLLCSCAPGVSGRTPRNPAGFFSGIWHGWIAPVTLIWQIFNPQVRIYEVNNIGWTYDFGFYMAIIAGFGGLALTRKRRCK
ncbi:MAG TPA: hypothetical protein PKH19_02715 [Candidatus Syntrophosphaera sp.]|nr:hypothetical protein [Candidatus Syntrophosphaera sp.]